MNRITTVVIALALFLLAFGVARQVAPVATVAPASSPDPWLTRPMPTIAPPPLGVLRLSEVLATADPNAQPRLPVSKARPPKPGPTALAPQQPLPSGRVRVVVQQNKTDVAATIAVDGVVAGRAPAFVGLPPGRHIIEARLEGRSKKVEVEVESGVDSPVLIEFD